MFIASFAYFVYFALFCLNYSLEGYFRNSPRLAVFSLFTIYAHDSRGTRIGFCRSGWAQFFVAQSFAG